MITRLNDVELVVVQLYLPNTKLIPAAVRPFQRTPEKQHESRTRRGRNNRNARSYELLDEKSPTALGRLVFDLERDGFSLVGCFWQLRVDRNYTKRKYVALRFTFARHPKDDAYELFAQNRARIRSGLIGLLNHNFWGIRVYKNPLYEEGQEVEGHYALSLNLGYRRDRKEKVCPTNTNEKKIRGEKKIFLQPAQQMRISSGVLELQELVMQ